jgi:TPR repeat protein
VRHDKSAIEPPSTSKRSSFEQGLIKLNAHEYAEAIVLLKSAADEGNPVASYEVAKLELGLDPDPAGVARDPNDGETYMLQAATGGFPAAQVYIGKEHQDKGDISGAREWYVKAANQGYPEADVQLATLQNRR